MKYDQKYWQQELAASKKRLRKWVHRGEEIQKRFIADQSPEYSDDDRRSFSLNLLNANVATLCAMLYGSKPQSDVSREFHDPDDDVARVACLIYQRIIDSDTASSGEGLPTILANVLQDRLLPGLGVARVRYEVETEKYEEIDEATGKPVIRERFISESAPAQYVQWADFLWGWARTWGEVEWIAFRSYLKKDAAEERFGEDVAKRLTYTNQSPISSEDDTSDKDQTDTVTQTAEVFEIWCKTTRKVYWVQPGQPEVLDELEDPLRLDGFWPVPKPMMANPTTRLFEPTPDFVISQDIYNQIDELYSRITIITRAIKVVGVYDQGASDSVGRMLTEGVENDLLPVDNWAMFAEAGGLKGKIDWYPVEQVVGVLQTLRQILEQQIALLYQVTGMSDILRGQSDQYTGVGQDQLKAKFGSIRLQSTQEDFARFASELNSLRAEVVSKHYEVGSIVRQSGAAFLPMPDKPLIEPALQLIKSEDVKFRVNIRPESIAMIDYQSLKAERTEYLMAVAQYIQSAQAMAKETPESLPVLLEMLKWAVAGFKGANYLEGILDQAIQLASKPPAPGQQGPSEGQIKLQLEELKAQNTQMKGQIDLQKIEAKKIADLQTLQVKMQGEIAKIRSDAQRDIALEDRQSQYALLEIAEEMDAKLKEIAATHQSTIAHEREQARLDMTVNEQEHGFRMIEQRGVRNGG